MKIMLPATAPAARIIALKPAFKKESIIFLFVLISTPKRKRRIKILIRAALSKKDNIFLLFFKKKPEIIPAKRNKKTLVIDKLFPDAMIYSKFFEKKLKTRFIFDKSFLSN